MVNRKHVAIVRMGRNAWNDWRANNPDVLPGLAGVDLSSAELSGFNLAHADLGGAILPEADLEGACLIGAHLDAADLSGARLKEARLDGASLIGANLGGSDLEGAMLYEATLLGVDFRKARLTGADFTGANVSSANFGGTNLRGVKFDGVRFGEATFVGACLCEASFGRAVLSGSNLAGVDLAEASFFEAELVSTDLTAANLYKAKFIQANLHGARLTDANLAGAKFTFSNLLRAHLNGADLRGADLELSSLVEADLTNADLNGARVFGISAWRVKLGGTKQSNLIVSADGEPAITVDHIEIAQFIDLLLHNEKIRDAIDTIGKKAVLILGRFTAERKPILDAVRDELRKRDYLPIIFDFDKPTGKDLTGTVSALAHMARFIIADLTDPSSIPYELAIVAPTTVVPIQPIISSEDSEFAMFDDLRKRHHWILPPHRYNNVPELISDLGDRVISPAEDKATELRGRI